MLERSRRRKDLELCLSGAEQGLWEWQINAETVKFNANWAIPLGYARGEMSPCVLTWQHIVHPDDWPTLFAARDAYFSGKSRLFDPEIRMRHKSDAFVWMQLHGKAVDVDEQQRPLRLMGTYMNIGRRKHAEIELRKRETQLATMIASLQDAVLVLDQAGRITMRHVPENSALSFLTPALLGQLYAAALPGAIAQLLDQAIADIRASRQSVQVECELAADDCRHYLHLTVNALAGSDQDPTGYLVVMQDITPRKMAEEEIRTLAFFDALTKLPNKRMLRDRLRLALGMSGRNGRCGAVLFVDLDNFRRLEQTHGHAVPDHILMEIARRLERCMQGSSVVACAGRDQFLVLLEDLSDTEIDAANTVSRVGEKIQTAINQAVVIADQEYRVTASIGAAMINGQSHSEDMLLQQVQLAKDSAKSAGGNTLKFFDPEMQASAQNYVALEQAIYKGLQREEFFLVYQPQLDSDGRIIGAEALVRWQHPEQGLLGPGHFIALAEETGLIVPLGLYVLKAACHQLCRWQLNAATAHLTVSVNVSSRQFEKPGFVDDVELLVQSSGINPRQLKFEITESLLLENTESIVGKMRRLREIGISLSLDDFGTGYASLAYLKNLPLDQLKIDQSFVRNAPQSSVDVAIIRSIMSLGKSLGIAVIAEGVETEAQWRFLIGEGCTLFQGFHFSRPCGVREFEAQL
ncbi:hypothetical protein TSA66_04340 [Noviherbaspirillum autotrophicum]|uniref:Diguanylate cyclase n=1 Tax=Noviherbaspirillum autotrophicum TaxID=709839 RepID=A0A0C2BTY1_9BURK|nr:hypothetical protein TSA66_04340 [Noviherbaspirillum autotrophicum]